MTEYALIETRSINNTMVDGYYNNEQAWFTRTQIGEALGYDDPNRQVARLHNRHRDRLDPLSAVVKLTTTDGKMYDTFIYSFRGVLEICRWSKQEKANEVMDALYDMAESIRKKGYFSYMSDNELLEMLVDKCLNNPKLEVRLSKNYLTGMKKLRLREEKENARIIVNEYDRKCNALVKYYNKHPAERGFNEEVESLTKNALHDLEEQCPHLEVPGLNKSAIRLKTQKEVI